MIKSTIKTDGISFNSDEEEASPKAEHRSGSSLLGVGCFSYRLLDNGKELNQETTEALATSLEDVLALGQGLDDQDYKAELSVS